MSVEAGLAEGTLLWTPAGPRPVERMVEGDQVVAFDPDAFERRVATVVRLARGRGPRTVALIGGRYLAASPTLALPRYEARGGWQATTLRALAPRQWLPVDRRSPLAGEQHDLPPLEEPPERLGETGVTPLALTDRRDHYFEEMERRRGRLEFVELLGYLIAVARRIDGELRIEPRPAHIGRPYGERAARWLGMTLDMLRQCPEHPVAARVARWIEAAIRPDPVRALPDWGWLLDHAARGALLRGYFDAAADVTSDLVVTEGGSPPLLVGLQVMLASLGVRARVRAGDRGRHRLEVASVRRFAEWVGSNVGAKAGTLERVYAAEPRYPDETEAILPLDLVRPAVERLRERYGLPRRAGESLPTDERELGRIGTLRLLAGAFPDAELRQLVNEALYLEPLERLESLPEAPLVRVEVDAPGTIIANGVVVMAPAVGPSG